MTPLLPSLLVACAANFVVGTAVEDDASLVQWRLNTLIAKGRTNRSGEGCTCGANDDEWDEHCICHTTTSCVWDSDRPCEKENPSTETGPADEKVPDDATSEYKSSGKGVSGTPHYIVGNFPIVAQNSLNVGGGDHACWAVTRAVNTKWAGLLGKKGPKAYANELYTGKTGWFIPTTGVSLLKDHHQRVFLNDATFTKDNVGTWVQTQIQSGKTIAVAMSNKKCASTFHYVTIIGVMPAVAGKVNKILVQDPWCPEYGSGPGYYTTKNTMTLGRYDNGKVDLGAMSHPCIRVSEITNFERRPSTKSEPAGEVGMMYLDNLNFNGGDGSRCTYKMWVVCHKTDNNCRAT